MRNLTELQMQFSKLLPQIRLQFEEPMAKHTSFKIGGPAEVMAFPKNALELSEILKTSALLDLKPAILGAGTNILAPDAGLSGLVICMKDFAEAPQRLNETDIRVWAGMSMASAAVFAAGQELSGLEFAHGIPGSVGGGVYMNAGAYGGEIADVCKSVDIMDYTGNISTLFREELDFSYRHSCLEGKAAIVLSVVFSLSHAPIDQIKGKMQELMQRRRASQPLELPSAGSAFKRPAGCYAAALIDEAGLKGFGVGGAAVSEKHAGFVVNLGGASADDVVSLLTQVSDIVFHRTGIRLEPEVRIW